MDFVEVLVVDEENRKRRRGWLQAIREQLGRWFRRKPEHPEDPFAYVMAPLKPRRPSQSATAVAEPPEE